MSDPNPDMEKDTLLSPKRDQPTKKQPDTPFLTISSEGSTAGFKTSKECLDALIEELKVCVTTLSEEAGLGWLTEIFKECGLDDEYFTETLLKFLQDNGQYSKPEDAVQRWTNIPVQPNLENELYPPYEQLFRIIIAKLQANSKFQADDVREARTTADDPQEHFGDNIQPAVGGKEATHKTKPDMLFLGKNPKFLPQDFEHSEPSELYKNAISVVEMKHNGSKDKPDKVRAQLAMYARQCYLQQNNRLAVYGGNFTETLFQLVLFDRSGAMESHWFNIHEKPVLFIQVICFLIGIDLTKLGFDPSITYSKEKGKNLKQSVKVLQLAVPSPAHSGSGVGANLKLGRGKVVIYEVTKIKVLSHARSIRGSGSVVRAAKEPGPNGAKVRIVDSWMHEDREKEMDIYLRAIKSGVEGLVPIKAAQKLDIKISTAEGRHIEDKVFRQNNEQQFPNLVFARLVTEGGYKSITEFGSALELLQVFRDAVQAHRDLLIKAQILHRNIQLTSVMISKATTKGGRKGYLTDLSMAVIVDRSESLFKRDVRVVGPTFQPRHLLTALATRLNHSCVEELEAFLYVMYWMFLQYEKPGKRVEVPNKIIDQFEYPSTSHGAKLEFIVYNMVQMQPEYLPTAYFNRPAIITLIQDLCSIVFKISFKKGQQLHHSPDNSERDGMYKSFIQAIDNAILGLQNESPEALAANAKPDLPSFASRLTARLPSPKFGSGSKSGATAAKAATSRSELETEKTLPITRKPPTTRKPRPTSTKKAKTTQRVRGVRQTRSTDQAAVGTGDDEDADENAGDKRKKKGAHSPRKRRRFNLNKDVEGSALDPPIDLTPPGSPSND